MPVLYLNVDERVVNDLKATKSITTVSLCHLVEQAVADFIARLPTSVSDQNRNWECSGTAFVPHLARTPRG